MPWFRKMKLNTKTLLSIFKKAAQKWFKRDPFRESSIISYNAIFSLPGLLVVVVTLAGYFFGAEAVDQHIYDSVADAMGKDTADQVREMIVVASRSKESIWATIIGVITILMGATGVFMQLQKSLNIIWEVEATTQKSGIVAMLKHRLFSFGIVLSIAFLLLISLVVSSLLAAAGEWMSTNWSESLLWKFNILNFLISLAVITFLFALMFMYLPDARIKWRFVWIGGFVTALLFVIGKTLLGLYFGKAEPGSGYGAAGSIVLIMLWVSYSSMIVFFGAEFTKAYSQKDVGTVRPNEFAKLKKGRKV